MLTHFRMKCSTAIDLKTVQSCLGILVPFLFVSDVRTASSVVRGDNMLGNRHCSNLRGLLYQSSVLWRNRII
ncbi:uncharacterized protein BYT42DRAFT_524442, partial [Radiomyces spectabilis]|uniref:uncharacterized protein n=1 Tax=Radiomyces spectabilis TaxID=64574 RepID=UPI00221EBA6D